MTERRGRDAGAASGEGSAGPRSGRRPRVLFLYADRIGPSMGGVGIRASELAQALAPHAEVRLAAAEVQPGGPPVPAVTFAPHAPRTLSAELAWADVVVGQPQWPATMAALRRSGARLVFDLYDPEYFGTLAHFEGRRARGLMAVYALDRLRGALRIGHHVMCASERQRDLWIGTLLGAGLLGPRRLDADQALAGALAVVPFGLPAEPPRPAGTDPRAALGLAADAEIVLWNGGIWRWLDAATAVRAAALLRARRPRATLVFMAAGGGPAADGAAQARALAAELGVLDAGVVFHDAWVPYAERADWLLAASCSVFAAGEALESRYAFRTRVLDCLWAGLPVACTAGDELAVRIARDELGAVAPPGDPAALAAALERVLERGKPAYASALARAAADYAWPVVTAPLRRWVLAEGPPPPRLGDGAAAGSRQPGELMRAAAYRAGAAVLGAARVGPPRADRPSTSSISSP